jgi:DNA-directed RNA polymerase subunit RPC12/RpoP
MCIIGELFKIGASMECKCPSCSSALVKKNGHIHNGKQKYQCLACKRQFVLDPTQKIVDEHTKNLVRKTLLERVSLEGVCRIFDISMPWLLEFMNGLIAELPEDLNAEVVTENDEIEVVLIEADELWSYVGSKNNPQWLWLVMHSRTRQVVAMQVGPRNKQTAEKLFYKLPESLKKKPDTILTTSLCTTRPSPPANIDLSEKNLVRRLTLKDLIVHSDNDARDW